MNILRKYMESKNLPNIKAMGILTSSPRGRTRGRSPISAFTHFHFQNFHSAVILNKKIERAKKKNKNDKIRCTT